MITGRSGPAKWRKSRSNGLVLEHGHEVMNIYGVNTQNPIFTNTILMG